MDNQCSYCNKGINSLLEIDINRKYKITLTLVSPKNTLDVLSIRNGFFGLDVDGNEIPIRFCPFCGRKL
ncbi:MAG: hypothetical protein UHK60_11600 [Acutalibacteraceae bacterium]|nr:hypothetical protein [Acutalibacteraceae bacterium]